MRPGLLDYLFHKLWTITGLTLLFIHRSISERLNKLATTARMGSRSPWSFHPPPATQENNPMVKQMRGWMAGMARDIADLDLLNNNLPKVCFYSAD